ncbi:hypothetical protein SAMN05216411_11113 [Nitrosospira multiformis]|nr:hypothetical protein SAMN05216411_11113 [Nitrosospira multiformis]
MQDENRGAAVTISHSRWSGHRRPERGSRSTACTGRAAGFIKQDITREFSSVIAGGAPDLPAQAHVKVAPPASRQFRERRDLIRTSFFHFFRYPWSRGTVTNKTRCIKRCTISLQGSPWFETAANWTRLSSQANRGLCRFCHSSRQCFPMKVTHRGQAPMFTLPGLLRQVRVPAQYFHPVSLKFPRALLVLPGQPLAAFPPPQFPMPQLIVSKL